MPGYKMPTLIFAVIVSGIFIMLITFAVAQESREMGGWGVDDPYNRYYDVKEFEKIRGWVKRIKTVVPLPGMSPGVALDVYEGSADFEVQLAPTWYIQPGGVGVKPGDRIKIKGVWAEINGKDVFIASKIKKGDHWELKVRLTKNGKPFWTMTPAELARERTQK
jgi:hypothetical protein